jgi:hypothetical protein
MDKNSRERRRAVAVQPIYFVLCSHSWLYVEGTGSSEKGLKLDFLVCHRCDSGHLRFFEATPPIDE